MRLFNGLLAVNAVLLLAILLRPAEKRIETLPTTAPVTVAAPEPLGLCQIDTPSTVGIGSPQPVPRPEAVAVITDPALWPASEPHRLRWLQGILENLHEPFREGRIPRAEFLALVLDRTTEFLELDRDTAARFRAEALDIASTLLSTLQEVPTSMDLDGCLPEGERSRVAARFLALLDPARSHHVQFGENLLGAEGGIEENVISGMLLYYLAASTIDHSSAAGKEWHVPLVRFKP